MATWYIHKQPSKKNVGIIEIYHSKIVKHIEMIQISICGERHHFWLFSADDG
jgi:hypothetical protein